MPNFVLKKSLKGIYLFVANIPKIANFGYFPRKAHIFKATTMKFGVKVRTWYTLSRA